MSCVVYSSAPLWVLHFSAVHYSMGMAKLSIVLGYLLLHLGWIGVQIGAHFSGF